MTFRGTITQMIDGLPSECHLIYQKQWRPRKQQSSLSLLLQLLPWIPGAHVFLGQVWSGCCICLCHTHPHFPRKNGPMLPQTRWHIRSWGRYQSQGPELPLGDLVLPIGAKLWGSGVGMLGRQAVLPSMWNITSWALRFWGLGVKCSLPLSSWVALTPQLPKESVVPQGVGLWAKKKKGWNQLPQTWCSPKLQSFLLDLEPALKCLSDIGFTILSSGELYLYILLKSVISFLTQTADPINFNFVCITFCEPTF